MQRSCFPSTIETSFDQTFTLAYFDGSENQMHQLAELAYSNDARIRTALRKAVPLIDANPFIDVPDVEQTMR